MNVVVVIQCRMSSTRLPGKVMLSAAGRPLLQHMLERIAAAQTPFELVVATTESIDDDPIRALCRRINVRCFSGHPTDLLDRHYQVARQLSAEVVVKIPSDCILIDPAAVDRVLRAYLDATDAFDFVTNLHPPTWPDGNDVEVMSMDTLATAWRDAKKPFEREHTTPFVWDQPERFRIQNVRWETGLDYSNTHRLVLDYAEDYTLISAIFDELWSEARPLFSLAEILKLLEDRPDLYQLNAGRRSSAWYRAHLADLRTVKNVDGSLEWQDRSAGTTADSGADNGSNGSGGPALN